MMKLAALLILFLLPVAPAFGQPTGDKPEIVDGEYVVERFVSGIPNRPTTMAFIGDDILVLQKHDGQVRLVRDGVLQLLPLLDANVANVREQGMLGIAVAGSDVYLYFTESQQDGGEAISKRVYKYRWDGGGLRDPVLVRELPATREYHNGGAMVTAPDGAVYLVIGDTGRYGILQNKPQSTYYEDTSVIMRVDQKEPYYAIGVRNSFGLAIDPVTGMMWDTENGDDDFDEVNLVEPGFNSGWETIMGPATEDELASLLVHEGYTYSDPEFSWEQVVTPVALSFVNSEPLAKFKDSLFVGDCNNGNLYRFTLNESRDRFVFASPELSDNLANRGEPLGEIIFGTDFGCITDMEVGPDGFLYMVSIREGAIFRLVPKAFADSREQAGAVQLASYVAIAAAAAGVAVYAIRRRPKSGT